MKSVNLWAKNWAEKNQLTVWYQPETTSTNQMALEKGRQYHLYLCDHQTQGRGRGGARWQNAKNGATFLSSWPFELKSPPQPITSPLVGLVVFQALKSVWPSLLLSLKAPNDIYLGNKKLAGILIESVSMGNQHLLVIGLGLNVFGIPNEISTATDLATQTEVSESLWEQFLTKLLAQLSEIVPLCTASEIPFLYCHQIRDALNLFPLKEEFVLEVDPKGNIITNETITPWFDL